MSSSISRRRSPKPGARTAQHLITPRRWLTTSVARASPSISSQITSSGWLCLATSSRVGSRSLTDEILRSANSTSGSSSTATCLSGWVMKYADRKPRSNCRPSTTSSSLATPEPSSIVIAPSRPTLSIAWAIRSPIERSLLPEIAATCAISADVWHGLASVFKCSTTRTVARSMPRRTSIGFMPAATTFMPSRTIACAITVAVVVPSPAISLVRIATSRTICAPMFSNGSASSTDLATMTPELTIAGAPKSRCSSTVRPRGPSVSFTASASVLTPSMILWRASSPNRKVFALMAHPRRRCPRRPRFAARAATACAWPAAHAA